MNLNWCRTTKRSLTLIDWLHQAFVADRMSDMPAFETGHQLLSGGFCELL